MKKLLSFVHRTSYIVLMLCTFALSPLYGQQLPDSHFENWSKTYNGDAQLADWNGSNVTQVGLKFTFMYQKPGRTGSCIYIADREIGAIGITATGPAYATLGVPFQYMKGLTIRSATAGTEGGIQWTHRPDTMTVWVKRVGPATDKEDFHLLYYSWIGTAKSSQYKNKVGGCTRTERVNEESDIRLLTDGNECGTDETVTQVAEAWYRARANHNEWTQIKVPVFYCADARPTMCNVIFSAGNYPAFRANDGLYDGNALYVDDLELIYSSKIDRLIINGEEFKGFDSNSASVQTFKLSNSEAQTVKIEALRGIGALTNIKGETAKFPGRRLDSKEMTIVPGELNGKPWTITVRAEDGSSTHVYKLRIIK
ncbi:MAG: hypothetical protein IJ814_06800 [Paludibacteraceae bacterium]|nr:hypothetical protein [Paludibacteraceae bacterium]